jgi:hypothetical protein
VIETGTLYRATLTGITGPDGLPADPATLVCTITLPDGTTSLPTVVKDSTGNYHADYLTTKPGPHTAQWTGTVPNITETDAFNVSTYRSILSLDDARTYLNLRDTSHDELLRALLAGITKLIERQVGTCVPRTYTADPVPGQLRDFIRLPHGPVPTTSSVTSITSVYPGGPTWDASMLIVDPRYGTVRTVSMIAFYYGPWTATYTAGRAEIPADIIEGAKAALYDLWAVQRGVSYDAIEPSMAEVAAYEAVPPGWRLPPRVMQFLDSERLPQFA